MPKEKQTLREVLPTTKKISETKKIEDKKRFPKNQTPDDDKTLIHLLRLVILATVVLVAGLIFVAWGTYKEEWQNSFIDSIYKIVPYPAASVGYTNWITLNDYNENVKAMRRFLESQEATFGGNKFDFSTEEGLKRLAIIKRKVLNQLIDNKAAEVLAKQKGISVSDAELADVTNRILARDGKESENLTQLSSLYNWGPADFRERVVRNLLYRQELEDAVKASGDLDKDAKEKVAVVKKKLSSGEDFALLAKIYSDSSSKQNGGLLAALSREEAPKAFADQAFKLGVGETSPPIEADDGWHFIKIEKRFQEGGKDKVELRHIMINKKTFDEWLQEKKKGLKVITFLKPYFWHEQMGKLYFKDDNLNKLEQELNRVYLNEKNQEADFLLNTSKK